MVLLSVLSKGSILHWLVVRFRGDSEGVRGHGWTWLGRLSKESDSSVEIIGRKTIYTLHSHCFHLTMLHKWVAIRGALWAHYLPLCHEVVFQAFGYEQTWLLYCRERRKPINCKFSFCWSLLRWYCVCGWGGGWETLPASPGNHTAALDRHWGRHSHE